MMYLKAAKKNKATAGNEKKEHRKKGTVNNQNPRQGKINGQAYNKMEYERPKL